ncbi:carboxypeptidase-like regulatory domain-containing protein [Mucilaginibacter myungsuensis]|uniref:Carboxypeptidase-like regulatory domain-containing protein n=1 Tax=Mucilaginibacter myungsuensis TaxID=649104 RepID=A0A929KXG8_9SPHI|nr:carboxypeptidase-like regulatory domain-containing protein [Mucilaginibacter myungsuensis]MBE9663444.1 carboxypeptidase-like regulatory domain-containing protein [Mucilaginibacter myungsuensis]MDN3600182.1 carboxypeptidase-like regulatory domain-containing protein [Mucilaginibacter myungsuensis]
MRQAFLFVFRTLAIVAFSFFAQGTAFAQSLSISGKVIDEQKLPMPSATVFLGGTKKITATDVDGKFSFRGLSPGSYIITVKMVGYTPYFQNVTIKESMTDIVIEMEPNATALREVKISADDKEWRNKYALFKQSFLGTTKNGRKCKIINPTVLRLWYENGRNQLKGSSDDFLIIENPELGYRVKYLIKKFEYDHRMVTTNYDGETSFEDMDGTPEQKAKWQQNRRDAYYGSPMHFFRAVYAGKLSPINEGFLVRGIMEPYALANNEMIQRMRPPVIIDPHPVKLDTIVTVLDSGFVALKFQRDMFIRFNKNGGPLKMLKIAESGNNGEVSFDTEASIMQLSGGEVIIDSRGKVAGDMSLLIVGKWGYLRIGDLLPFEYRPDPQGNSR